MKITLTKQQMLERCRLYGGFEPRRSDCSIEFTDGIDLDEYLAGRLRQRYLELLDTGPEELLAPDNISAMCSMSAGDAIAGGSVMVLPEMCRRVFSVRMKGWHHSATVLPAEELGRVLQWQSNPYGLATALHPVAVADCAGVAGAAARIYVWPAGAAPEVVTAVLDPGEDFFTLDEAGIDKLFSLNLHSDYE